MQALTLAQRLLRGESTCLTFKIEPVYDTPEEEARIEYVGTPIHRSDL